MPQRGGSRAGAGEGMSSTSSSGLSGSFLDLVRRVAEAPGVALTVAEELAPGTLVDEQFEIVSRLGAGGMGVVFLARDRRLGREVALKVMRLSRWPVERRATLMEAFENEARATARLNHPNVVTLHDFGVWNGLLYIVLERLRGETLAERIERGALPADEALALSIEVARGVAQAHAAGLVHRDLKPHNVFLHEGGLVKVLDFGLSGLQYTELGAGADGASATHGTVSRAGTPAYMAPEQWSGGAQDARTDVWAAGIMLYELVRGRRPFTPTGADSLRVAPDLDAIPRPIAAVLARCLAFAPGDRFADARALEVALVAARRALARRARLRRWRWIAPLIGLLGAGGGVVLWRALAPGQPARVRALPSAQELDLTGLWRFDPGGVGVARIKRLSPERYYYRYSDGPIDAAPTPQYLAHAGELTLARRGDQLVLSGNLVDLPGSLYNGGVSHVEMVVESRDRLWLEDFRWGPTLDNLNHSYEPHALVRVPGP